VPYCPLLGLNDGGAAGMGQRPRVNAVSCDFPSGAPRVSRTASGKPPTRAVSRNSPCYIHVIERRIRGVSHWMTYIDSYQCDCRTERHRA
jgi:hypothetical protein